MRTFALPMSRFFIQIKYRGTNYHGWQLQPNANSVQAEINKALSTLFQEDINVTGAGRTDTGVHAQEFFAHFDTQQLFDLKKYCFKLNCMLPQDIACVELQKVPSDLHARFSASKRTYEYWITPQKNPFLMDGAYFFHHPLNVNAMNAAAQMLIRKADFSCFSKSNTDTFTNDCHITQASWELKNDLLVFTISSDRFLRNMVRAIVGTLLEVGLGKVEVTEMENIIASKDRSKAGSSVPAHGLYLTNIKYPDNGC